MQVYVFYFEAKDFFGQMFQKTYVQNGKSLHRWSYGVYRHMILILNSTWVLFANTWVTWWLARNPFGSKNIFRFLLQSVYTFVYNKYMDTIEISGFQWDKGNQVKCQKHGVSIETIETLFQRPVAVLPDETHSQDEQRFRAIGKTDNGRYVFVVFTLRHDEEATLIRPISARYMHKKEVAAYEKENPDL